MDHRKAAILGAGPIGLSVLLALRLAEASTIYVTDKLDYRCNAARKHGANWAGRPEGFVDMIGSEEPSLLDSVFECSGQQEALDQALQIVKPGGSIQVIGIPEFDRYTFDAHLARRHEVVLRNIRRQNGCTQPAIDAIARKNVDIDFIITHEFGLSQVKDAFELLRGYEDGVIKAIIHVDE